MEQIYDYNEKKQVILETELGMNGKHIGMYHDDRARYKQNVRMWQYRDATICATHITPRIKGESKKYSLKVIASDDEREKRIFNELENMLK